MSDYRDDTVETLTASDEVWGGFKGRLIEDYGYLAAALFVSIGVLHTDQATASDAVVDRPVGMIEEQAGARDEVQGAMRTARLVTDSGVLADRVSHRIGAVLTDTGTLADTLTAAGMSLVVESAAASDAAIGVLHARGTIQETGRVRDVLVRHASGLVEDGAGIEDRATGRLRARVVIEEAAAIADEVPHAHAATGHISEHGTLFDEAAGQLHAISLVEDSAQADAVLVSDEVTGQAWVSEAGNWAMSRYAPFGFEAAAVVDGVVYLAGPDGLYALDGVGEPISGHLRTGKVDAGAFRSRPLYAYLEHTLEGAASVEVALTEDGQQEQAWTFPLEREPAAVLTSGRVPFGRGLRGRHFTFALNLDAKRAYINDMTVLIEPGSRRI